MKDYMRFENNEERIRNHTERLRRLADKGEWMSESPTDYEIMLGEIDSTREKLIDLYIKSIQEQNPLAAELLNVLGTSESIKLLIKAAEVKAKPLKR